MPIDFKTHKTQMTQIAQQKTLKLDQNTTMEQLGTFLSSKSGKAEILAKKDREGNTILYTRETGGMNFLRNLKDNFRKTQVDDNRVNTYDHKRQFANEAISGFLKAQGEQISRHISGLEQQVAPDKSLAKNIFETFDSAGTVYTAKRNGFDAALVGQTVKLLANLEQLAARVTRSLEAHTAIKETIPDLPPTQNQALQETREFRFVVDGDEKTIAAPNLMINGETFVPTELKGAGGFGALLRYVGPNNTEIAVKLPISVSSLPNDVAEQKDKAKLELFNTDRMIANNPNATGFTGHVILSNGMVGLVGDYMSKGDLMGMAGKVANVHVGGPTEIPPPPGKIGDFERYVLGMTLIKDAANGVAEINAKGLTHGDVKSLNVMLGEDGTAKIIDLGEGMETSKISPDVHNYAMNAAYGAPEYGLMSQDVIKRTPEVNTLGKQMLDNSLQGIVESLESILPSFDKGEGQNQIVDTFSERLQNIQNDLKFISPRLNNGNLKVGASFDSFGLGTIGLELFIGGSILDEKPEKIFSGGHIENWVRSGKDAIGPGGLRQQGSDYGPTNDLLNGMLHSDPKQRLTPDQIRNHGIMQNPAIGSPQARALILAVQSGDPQKITDAVNALRQEFAEYL